MWHWFSHVSLTAAWSKVTPNPHGKSHHFLTKCPGNPMILISVKSMSCLGIWINNWNLDKWHGMVMEFGVNWDQTAVDLWHEITWNSHENPYHIFYRCRERHIWRKTHWSLASLVTNASFVSFLIIYGKAQIFQVFTA